MLVFRKRGPHDEPAGEDFAKTVPVPDSIAKDAQGMEINEYYVEHPGNILGQLSTRYNGDVAKTLQAAAMAPSVN